MASSAPFPACPPGEASAVDAAIDAARLAPTLTTALSGLQAKDRELLLLIARDGRDPDQAGTALSMSAKPPAFAPVSRVRKRLQGILTDLPAPDPHPGGTPCS